MEYYGIRGQAMANGMGKCRDDGEQETTMGHSTGHIMWT